MSRYPKQWRITRPITWPASPTEMSVSLLREIEDCPRKWALEHANYPEIWNRNGYPSRIHMPSLIVTLTHSCVERIIGELAKAGCRSIHDDKAVDVMRSLGGYTTIIRSYMQTAIDSYKENPRAEYILDLISSSLLAYVVDIRSKVQFLLGRMNLDAAGTTNYDNVTGNSMVKQRSALSYGIHPEVDMRVPSMHWRGKADLIVLTDSICELIDFKTGEHTKQHEFQMCVYALLWYRDSVLNPSSRLASKLKLSYLQESVEVQVPTIKSLGKFELEILERTKNLSNILSTSPPSPLPNIERCVFCDVRHLCEAYWKIKVSSDCTPEGRRNNLVDVEVTLIEQHSPLSWNITVDAGPYLKPGFPALLRIPINHYLTYSVLPKDRLRVLDAGLFFDPLQESNTAILTLNNFSEAYAIKTED